MLSCSDFWDHPRVGGEKLGADTATERAEGSPPRMRGKEQGAGGRMAAHGITPARAGKRQTAAMPRTMTRDHPRMGGEKLALYSMPVLLIGLPPRGRGKEVSSSCCQCFPWITPAWAGKRGGTLRLACCTADHPRMGGEKRSDRLDYYFPQGSPPHGRGKGQDTLYVRGRYRITPA